MNMPLVVIDTEQQTLDDVIAALRANAGLTERRRRDLISAVRSTARLLNRNAPEIEADMAHLRERLRAIHPVQAGISAKRLANIKADLAHALRVARAAPRRPRRVHRTPEWGAFFAALEKPWQRYSLARFATFCSHCGISPADVDDHPIGRFRSYLAEASLAKDPDKTLPIRRSRCRRRHQQARGCDGAPLPLRGGELHPDHLERALRTEELGLEAGQAGWSQEGARCGGQEAGLPLAPALEGQYTL